MWEAGLISRLVPNAQMWPLVPKVRVLCRGLGASSPRKFYILNLEKCYLMRHSETMKQKITPDLGKSKGDISEI